MFTLTHLLQMKFPSLISTGLVLASVSSVQAAGVLIIDDFNSSQFVTTAPTLNGNPFFIPTSSVVAAPSAVGGSRQLSVTSTGQSGFSGLNASSNDAGPSVFRHETASGVMGTTEIFYGGGSTGPTPATRNYNGLGGFDFFSVNPLADAVRFSDLAADAGITILVRMFPFSGAPTATPPGTYAETSVSISGPVLEIATDKIGDWTYFGGATPSSFSSVGSFLVSISSSTAAADLSMGSISFVAIPEPGMSLASAFALGMVLVRRRRK
jgi:hypothetical protein